MTSTFWTDGYRDGASGAAYSPPEHSATSVYTAEYQRGYNKGCEDLIALRRDPSIGGRIKLDPAA